MSTAGYFFFAGITIFCMAFIYFLCRPQKRGFKTKPITYDVDSYARHIEQLIKGMEDTDDYLLINKKINRFQQRFTDDPEADDRARELRELLDIKYRKASF